MEQQDLAVLNRQAIAAAKQHMGQVAWGTVALTAVTLTGYVATMGLAITGGLPLWAGVALLGALTYLSYTPLHEAAHGNIHGDRAGLKWLNELCGYISAQMIMVPYGTHRVEHFTHHRYTNQPGMDPDHVVSGMGGGAWLFVKAVAHFVWNQWTFLFHGYWATAPLSEKLVYVVEVVTALGWRAALLVLLPWEQGVLLVPVAWFAGALFTAYWFAYRPHHPYDETARYRNTSSLLMPVWMKPFEWFWLGQNLHSIHHAFPRVPFYRYHSLFREIEPVLRAHGGPILGIFSRRPVVPAAR